MPQKTREQKERAAARRESGQMKAPVQPAPIELQAAEPSAGYDVNVPSKPVRRGNTAVAAQQVSAAEFDYSYVYSDLRRIGLLALLCFGVMIALKILLR
jgi:hypothetical protein